MRILLISDIETVLDKTLDIISERNFCDFCVSLGDVPIACLNKMQTVLKCDMFCVHGDGEIEDNVHSQLFNYDGKQMCYINYSETYGYWKDRSIKNFDSIINRDIKILFTHHSPKEHVDIYGLPDKPDYVRHLVQLIQPKINIHGHEYGNTIGTMKTYKRPDVTVIGIAGIVLLELNSEYQIKKFIAIE